MISGQNMISGSFPIESGRAQGCLFSRKMEISDSGSSHKLSDRIRACSRLYFCPEKMAILDSGSKFLDSAGPSIESGHAQGCFFLLENDNLGCWKPILGFWK